MRLLFTITSIALVVSSVWIFIAALRVRQDAMQRNRRIDWAEAQARRATLLVQSSSKDDVVAGLQILRALNVPSAVAIVLKDLKRLVKSSDERVAEQARSVMMSLTERYIENSLRDDDTAKGSARSKITV
jgi:hypothetical protein